MTFDTFPWPHKSTPTACTAAAAMADPLPAPSAMPACLAAGSSSDVGGTYNTRGTVTDFETGPGSLTRVNRGENIIYQSREERKKWVSRKGTRGEGRCVDCVQQGVKRGGNSAAINRAEKARRVRCKVL